MIHNDVPSLENPPIALVYVYFVSGNGRPGNEELCLMIKSFDIIYHWPLLLTWFNFNPRMDK